MGKRRQSRKRNQKGGAWYNPLSWGQPSDPNVPRRSWGQWISGTSNNVIQGADNAVGSAANFISTGAQNTFNSASNLFSSNPAPAPVPGPAPAPVPAPAPAPVPYDNQNVTTDSQSSVSQETVPVSNSSMGGKRRMKTMKMKSRKMKGGYTMMGGPENLAYYASPVHGLKVASPTYWVSSSTNAPLSGGTKRRLKKRKTRRHKK
jgi:hypothetical protein